MFRLIDGKIYEGIDTTQELTKEFMGRFVTFYLDEDIIRFIKTIVPAYDNLQARYPTMDLVFGRFGDKNMRKIFDWTLAYIQGDKILKKED